MNWRDVAILRHFMFWEHEISDRSIDGRRHLVQRIERMCRGERDRGISGDWNYSLPMHRALYSVLRRESAELAAMEESSTEGAAKPIAAE